MVVIHIFLDILCFRIQNKIHTMSCFPSSTSVALGQLIFFVGST